LADEGPGRVERWAAPLAAVGGAVALYLPEGVLSGRRDLYGSDFLQIHQYRMEFVREAWAHGFRGVPGWYPREALGMPFLADIQSFPFVPTRLLLLLFPPHAAYGPGILLAAALAALFAHLFARALGMRPLAAAAAGFTFAASSFFASRVMAGHLPLLEAYPALPLLLWLAERFVSARADGRYLLGLALAAFCVALAGHPQLPFYALVACAAYLVFRLPRRRVAWPLAALALGVAMSPFVWLPTLRLIGRSTRVLALDRPDNDVAFPLARVPALFAPWRDGWPAAVVRSPEVPLRGYRSDAVFWETASYTGWAPWVAAAALLAAALRRKHATRPAIFLALASAVCALLSFDAVHRLLDAVPGTIFRSPARLWYVPVLGLALAFGAALDALFARVRWRALAFAVAGLNAVDLAVHARPFVRSTIGERERRPRIEEVLARGTGTFRVALDYNLPIAPTRRYDDVGFFTSLQPASTYRALLALARSPARLNIQYFSGAWQLDAAALKSCGVRYVGSLAERPDLVRLLTEDGVNLYEVPEPVPRALFFPDADVRFWNEPEMPRLLASPRLDRVLLLPLEEAGARTPEPGGSGPRTARFDRPSPDAMEVAFDADRAGWVRVLESHDPGWSATLDGVPARVVRSESFLMAVRVPAGSHVVRFAYATPGARAGALLSLAALTALVLFLRVHGAYS
jgi:hypothetical protein